MGQDYLRQILMTGYAIIVAVADRNYATYPPMVVPVICPDDIHKYEFDYVVVAIRVAIAMNDILTVLESQGIPQSKIVCIYERFEDPELFVSQSNDSSRKPYHTSLDDNIGLSIAIMLAGGYGDHIIQKRVVTELISFLPKANIDIYCIRYSDFLRYLYSDCPQVKNVIDDLGVRYRENVEKYSLSLHIEACHFMRVDHYEDEVFNDGYPDFAEHVKTLIRETVKDGINLGIPTHISNIRRWYKGLNAYSGFNYNGAFNIADKKVNIPITEKGLQYLATHVHGTYFTINGGVGECKDGSKASKSWPIERFQQVVNYLRDRYPKLQVVQLGAPDSDKIQNAQYYFLGLPMEIVAAPLQGAVFHLDIEGGLPHMPSQIATNCIVLFGATSLDYYG
ncbi:MAG: hypothetical protein K6G30_06345, partial [Acetatifactor sp.]|nr:hypothetical protein [Acetatifactor sp.]